MADPELEAVESALNTLALAETEAALQKVVTRLLPALLSALSTKSPAARAKCIETLQHINVRVRALPNIKLPFLSVLHVATDPAAAVLTTNVAIQGGYLMRCFDRLSRPEKAAALSALVRAAAAVASQQNKDFLHFLAMRALSAAAAETPRSSADDLWKTVQDCPEPAVLLFFDYALLALRGKLKTPVQEPALLAIIRLASEYAGVKQPERAAKVFPHFLVAAGTSTRTALVAAGEDAMKRVDTCDVLAAADPTISNVLFDLFNDTLAEVPLRIVILSKGLLRVTLCASCFPEVLNVFRHSLLTPGIPSRFQALGMQFVSFVTKNCEEGTLEENAGSVIHIMMTLMRNETEGSPSFPDKLRGFGYTGLADLIVRIPSLMGTRDITAELFFAGTRDTSLPLEVRICASRALVTLTRVVRFESGDTSEMRSSILATLLNTVENDGEDSIWARSAAVQWANECFSFDDCEARLVDIVAAGDARSDVRQHAVEGLSPKRWHRKDDQKERELSQGDRKFTDFVSMVQTYSEYAQDSMRPRSVAAYLQFALSIVKHAVIPSGRVELLQVTVLEKFFEDHPPERQALSSLLDVAYRVLLARSPATDQGLERAALTVTVFGSRLKAFRSDISQRCVNHVDDLISVASRKSATGDITSCNALSALVGIASECMSKDKVEALINRIGTKLEPDPSGVASGRHGEDDRVASILSLGQLLARYAKRDDPVKDESETSVVSKACLSLTRRVTLAVDSSSIVRTSACTALAEIGAGSKLPLTLASREITLSTLAGVMKLHSSEPKLVQAASDAIGRICVGEPRPSFKRIAIEALVAVCRERKEEELRFSASESLVRCASGFDGPPPVAADAGDSSTQSASNEELSEELSAILLMRTEPYQLREVILDDDDERAEKTSLLGAMRTTVELAYDERPNARAGGCVGVFTFLRMLGSKKGAEAEFEKGLAFQTPADKARYAEAQEVVQNFLPEAQQAFSTLLADRSDFVQHLASCGVALVYDMCPPPMQRDLVSNLVRSLTSGKARAASTVPGDQGTLLELGGVNVKETGVAGRAATYKELCTLAQDMGQPELVYKFMDLAGHTALWNNRKGAALAGRALLDTELAAEQLRPHIKSLLPRLYVYCYDPTDSVKTTMGSVLKAVVKASGHGSVSEAVTENFDLITQHCLQTITSRQWRSREAACGALRDALVSKAWEQVKHNLADFWYYTLRALDDIKESVRKAAEGLGRAISELSIHLCDPAQVSVEVASEAVAVVVPCVMPAFTHRAEEVRILATKTLSEVIRFGGEALKSSVPDLVSNLLEAATELEPMVLNYAQFHVDAPEELQSARVDAATTSASPLIDSLERLSGLVDESNVEQIVPKLARLARVGVGIPTRAATARFYGTVLQSRATVVEPYAPKLMLSAAGAAGMERNPSLRSLWCSAAGTAAKLSPTEDVGKFVRQISDFSNSEDPQERSLASSLAVGLWRKSPDTARKHASAMLPIAYMGRYETDDDAKGAGANWKEVWSEGAPSTEAGLRLYAGEITQICQDRLSTSSQYRVKRSAAAALGALAEASNETVNVRYLSQAAQALLSTLPGHIWDGKVVAIEALGIIASSYSSFEVWREAGGPDSVVRRLLQETDRGKKEYRLAAIESATKLLKRCRDDFDLYDDVTNNLAKFWAKTDQEGGEGSINISRIVWETGSDADAVDARNKARKAQKLLCVAAIACLEAAYPGQNRADYQASHIEHLLDVMESVIQGDWDIRLAVLQALERVSSRAAERVLFAKAAAAEKCPVERIAELSKRGTLDAKYAALRRCGLSILLSLGKQVSNNEAITACLNTELTGTILEARQKDSDPGVQSDAKKVCALFELDKMSD